MIDFLHERKNKVFNAAKTYKVFSNDLKRYQRSIDLIGLLPANIRHIIAYKSIKNIDWSLEG